MTTDDKTKADARRKMILCVDFDGVIHSYSSGWQGAAIIPDPPVRGALRWLWAATEFWDVKIYSSRSKDPMARDAMRDWMIAHSKVEFEADHPMTHPDVDVEYPITLAHEKPAAFLTIDDRAICFDGDWGALDPACLLSFTPWNKRAKAHQGAAAAAMRANPIDEVTMEGVRSAFRTAAAFQRNRKPITLEHGQDLVNLIALHGDAIADRLTN